MKADSAPHVKLEHVSLQLNRHAVLNDISLRVRSGESLALIGPSGAGKTSLLRVIATEFRATPSLHINGIDPWQLNSAKRQQLRQQIGMVWQKPPLPGAQRVLTAIQAGRLGQRSLARALLAWWRQDDGDAIAAILNTLGVADKLFKRCDELSGGQLQRVAIARLLYQSPALMLADEPVSSLDPVLAEQTINVLKQQAHAQQATFICSLHAVHLAKRYFPRLVGLRDGRILFDCESRAVTSVMLRELYAGDETIDTNVSTNTSAA